ncbi:Hypothetical predicted protein [Paramuricea clavata]|uniref:Uncharacterized protein n=1 Tax=Paramuricea clavata TaxID=317549 RepID=A0A7D9EMT7_PARCT|nr:Hypothetical predicted protein [Paramuricea clavata]
MESSVIEHEDMDEEGSLPFCEDSGAFHSVFEDDFEQTLAMLDMDVEEVMIEVENSHEEVDGNKQFARKFASRRVVEPKQQRSKHMAELGESSTSSSTRDVVITTNKTRDIIRDIGRYLTDEKLHKPEQAAEVLSWNQVSPL